MQKPSLGRIVHYRDYRGTRRGFFAPRAAIVVATMDSLDSAGGRDGDFPPLTDDESVHLWVYAPGDRGGFMEHDVPFSDLIGDEIPPGSWYWPPRV